MLVVRSRTNLGLRLQTTSSPCGWTIGSDKGKLPSLHGRWRHYSTQQSIHPLRILFCGSDDFSICSLQAIAQLPSSLVESIDVVSRPPKRTGRGLKTLTYPPIHEAATSLKLPIHQIDTFTRWQPPRPIDLIVAVSFGLLIPPRILSLARFGGVNVHPSFLPDLHGPAPIQWALLHSDSHTGVTLQTLHPTSFDRGSIIAQTPRPGLALDTHTLPSAIEALGHEGAALLTQSIEQGSFARPGAPQTRSPTARHAPKLGPQDSRLDRSWTTEQLLRRAALLGPLWDDVVHDALVQRVKRVQYTDWTAVDPTIVDYAAELNAASGPDAFVGGTEHGLGLIFRLSDGGCLAPMRIKVEGGTWKDTATLLEQYAARQ